MEREARMSVDLDRVRLERLGRSLAGALEGGHAIADVSAVGDVEEWRRAARSVAADRRWRVRTGVPRDGSRVWAIRLDRETTEQCCAITSGTWAPCSAASRRCGDRRPGVDGTRISSKRPSSVWRHTTGWSARRSKPRSGGGGSRPRCGCGAGSSSPAPGRRATRGPLAPASMTSGPAPQPTPIRRR